MNDPLIVSQVRKVASILRQMVLVEGGEFGSFIAVKPAKVEVHSKKKTVEDVSNLKRLEEIVKVCTACVLHEHKKHYVFGEGEQGAKVMFIGEAPGSEEDNTGRPFVGLAGQLLSKIIKAMELDRERDTYICNAVKCRPPDNRTPSAEEVMCCNKYLIRQIELVNPICIVALGGTAAFALTTRSDGVARQRGRMQKWRDFPLIVTYHPAALLRDPSLKRLVWEDMKMVMRLLKCRSSM